MGLNDDRTHLRCNSLGWRGYLAVMSDLVPVRRALISVSDKTALADFARALVGEFGVELISTGGTAKFLREQGLAVTDVAQVTGFPEMMDGRIKTLHPLIHGGLLALRDNPDHQNAMRSHGIKPIDLVCINLYPFEQTISRSDVRFEDAIENIDIGGPAMIRSAAKNHRWVLVVTSRDRYDKVLGDLREHGGSCCGKHRLKGWSPTTSPRPQKSLRISWCCACARRWIFATARIPTRRGGSMLIASRPEAAWRRRSSFTARS